MGYKAVIVNYCKTKMVLRLLQQLQEQSLPPACVSIIDNSPLGAALPELVGSPYKFEVEIQYRPENIGYAKACNLGAGGQEWTWLALLNPDIELHDSLFFERAISLAQPVSDLGCLGVAQENPDGSYEVVARRFPSIRAVLGKRVPLLGRMFFSAQVGSYLATYPCQYSPGASLIAVDWLQSSFLLVPRAVWKETGGLDERFFVFMADVDFGHRCLKAGLRSYLAPSLKVHADGVRSSAGGILQALGKRTIRIHIVDAAKYFARAAIGRQSTPMSY